MRLIDRILTGDVPLIDAPALLALFAQSQVEMAQHPVIQKLRDYAKPQMELRQDGIAVIPVEGTLAYKPDPFDMLFNGVEDSRNVQSMVDAATVNPDVKGVLLDVDSPGGMALGGFEIADAVRNANTVKPVMAWSGGTMASLAYLIGSQGSGIVSTRTAQVGSVGTIAARADISNALAAKGIRFDVFTNKAGTLKSMGHPAASLTDEQRAFIQQRVEKVFSDFQGQVLSKRSRIPNDAMRGQTFAGQDAKNVGLVDAIGDKGFAISMLKSQIRARG